MKLITALNEDAKQKLNLVLDNGSLVEFSVEYVPNQQGWVYSINSGSFKVNNRRLVVSPNMLRAFRRIIPFGLACVSLDGYEPLYQTDFTSGRISIYVLNSADVLTMEQTITVDAPKAAGYFVN